MPSRLAIVFCAAMLASACTAPASRTADAPDAGADAAGADLASASGGAATAEEDPIVCETITRTGSRVAERTCMRRSVAEKRQREGKELLENVQRGGTQVGNPTGN